MAAKKSSFDKVLNAWDVLVIAFGAMIGWAWVVSTGDWITGGVGIVFVAASVLTGSTANLDGQLFMGATTSEMAKGTLAIAVMTPFYFIGFDVIPQAAEEISDLCRKSAAS